MVDGYGREHFVRGYGEFIPKLLLSETLLNSRRYTGILKMELGRGRGIIST